MTAVSFAVLRALFSVQAPTTAGQTCNECRPSDVFLDATSTLTDPETMLAVLVDSGRPSNGGKPVEVYPSQIEWVFDISWHAVPSSQKSLQTLGTTAPAGGRTC